VAEVSNPGHKLFLQRHCCLRKDKEDLEVFLKLFHRNLQRRRKDIMKTTLPRTRNVTTPIRFGRLRPRIAAGAVLFAAAAALAAVAVNPNPPKLPWAVPTLNLPNLAQGFTAQGVAVDSATNTIYVASIGPSETGISGSIAVFDGSKCNPSRASRCPPIATITEAGGGPSWLVFDPSSSTLYAASQLTPNFEEDNTLRVFNTTTCNARNTSGCGQPPAATLSMPGRLYNQTTALGPWVNGAIVLDSSAHTLYVGDA